MPAPVIEAAARRTSVWRAPRVRSLVLLGSAGAIGGLLFLAARIYTDLLWFEEVGQAPVLWTTLRWKLVADWLFPLGTACLLLANFFVVERVLAASPAVPSVWRPIAAVWPVRRLVYVAFAGLAAVVVAQSRPGPPWQQLLLWAHRSDFGQADPLFHRDVGYYVFDLPVYEGAARWALLTLGLAAGAALAVYLAGGAVQVPRPLAATRGARAHLLALAALLLAAVAWRFQLDTAELALPHQGSVVPGASYTDVHVRLPILRALMYLSLVSAGVCLVGAVRRVQPKTLTRLGLAIGAVMLASSSLPGLVEKYDVAPQELTRERPYLADSIAATRQAYDLDAVDVHPMPGDGRLSAQEVEADRDTLDNISLWDPQVLRASMNELESIGRYYGFPSTTVDRYRVDGRPRLMTIGPRALDTTHVGPGWATERFAYTHGYGVVGARAAEADAQRYPHFAQRNFGDARNPLGVREPRIYFGERSGPTPDYVVANTSRGEVEQPIPGTDSPGYHYGGPGGIPMSSPLRRLAFAARFRDVKLLLTGTVTPRSRMILHRDARDRLTAVAPFLRWDRRPHAAVIGGRIQFLFHGYTTSSRYPYAQPVRFGGQQLNYVRAPALAAVDSYSGEVHVYAVDGDDPLLRAWRGAYPTLFEPAERMPPGLRAHLRYPRRLLQAQIDAYLNYHATDVTGFWNGSDAWQRALRIAGQVERAGEIHFPNPEGSVDPDERREGKVAHSSWDMQPEYVLARMPGDTRLKFMLVMPFTPRGRHNLVGYLTGWIDPLGKPRLKLLSLPRDRLAVGPAQATRRILGSPGVNRRVELLNRESRDLGRSAINRTVLGSPRLVPVGNTLLHVQTIYVTSGGSTLPRLQLVTVQANGRVGYGRDLESALRRVVPDLPRRPRRARPRPGAAPAGATAGAPAPGAARPAGRRRPAR